MFTVIDYNILKELGPFFVAIIYLLNVRVKITLRGIIWIIALFPVLYLVAYYFTGFTLADVLTNTWRKLGTPIQYAFFICLNYLSIYQRTQDQAYSVTVAVHLASACGYLYEVPRYLFLQGVPVLLRVNKFSPVIIDYAILAIPIIYTLYQNKGYTVTKQVIAGLILYLAYCVTFYIYYPYLFHTIRREIIYCIGFKIPWINLYRLPTMVMLWCSTKGLNKHFNIRYTGV